MKKTLILSLAFLTVSACAPGAGQNVYSAREVGVAKSVDRCRVLAVRDITIQGNTGPGIGQVVGTVAGSVAGGTLGNQIGNGNGQAVATVLSSLAGSLVGGLFGDRIGAQADRRPGLEYAILDASGREITFAQEILPGDRIINAGETCRIQTDPYGNNRVLPVNGLPQQIQRPQTTTFY
jgi:outer membrane lipoprotein SlyB